MNSELIGDLTINASLLLTISIIYNTLFIRQWKRKKLFDALFGILIGIVGILLMINAVTVSSGIIFDTRSILISTTGMFFGFIPTGIAVLIISVYRIAMGGAGALTGVIVTVLTAGTGLLWYQLRTRHIIKKKGKVIWIDFYLFGVVTHLIMLASMLTLPDYAGIAILKEITLPVLLIYPVASLLLSMLIFAGFKNMQVRHDLIESELNFRTIFEQSPIGIAIAEGYRVLYNNPVFSKIMDRSEEEMAGLDWKTITHPDDLAEDSQQFEAMQSGKIDGYSMIKRYIKPDGSIVWVNMMIAALKVGNSEWNKHLCMIQDITEIIKAKEDTELSEKRYKNLYHEYQARQQLLTSLLNSIPDLIFYKDLNGFYLGCNNAFEKFVGVEKGEIVGYTDYELFDKEVANSFREMDQRMIEQKTQRKNEEQVTYPDGSKVFLETLKTPFYDPQGDTMGIIGVSRDISERKQKEDEILYLSYHDVLTDLYNRTFWDEERKHQDSEEFLPLSVVIGDINGLKMINDAFGQAAGDNLLVEIAKILKSCCREQDIIARTGGDEFSILLPCTDDKTVKMIYEKIKKTCEEHATESGKEIYYTSISLGYATKVKKEEPFDNTIKTAEEFMYRRKLLESRSLHSAIISSIRTTMFEKSDETEIHAERLAYLSKKLGRALGLREEDLVSLELVSTLHDIGKISIDRNILTKSDELSAEEWVELRKHPEVGYRIAQTVPELRRISEYILCHHERWDGEGYPQGLAGESIPLLSRIISIVDSYDAMTQDRSYRKAMSKQAAIGEIERNSGTQFDPKIAKIFVEQVLPDEQP